MKATPNNLLSLIDKPYIQQANEIAKSQNTKLYLVGGAIRDAFLGRLDSVKDYDFAVTGISAVQLAKQIADKIQGHFVLLDEKNDTARVVLPSKEMLDFAYCVGNSIEDDLTRRDFTINALALDLNQPQTIIDKINGLKDIEDSIIRCNSEEVLLVDPLRTLRAFRFMAMLDFSIENKSIEMITKHQKLLSSMAGERIHHEIFAIAKTSLFGQTLNKMAQSGILEIIFPEITDLHKVPGNAYHHLPLFDHSLETANQIEIIEKTMPKWVLDYAKMPLSYDIDRLSALKIAALLHDIGKPSTWQITEEGKHTFIAHDKIGAEMCDSLSERLKLSKIEEKFISKLVRWHLRPGHLFHQGNPTVKAINRFYRNIGEEVPELIWLSLADFDATKGKDLQEGRQEFKQKLYDLLDGYDVFIKEVKTKKQLLSGNDVMKLLGLKPCPLVGQILTELLEAQDLQEVTNRQEAIDFVHNRYKDGL